MVPENYSSICDRLGNVVIARFDEIGVIHERGVVLAEALALADVSASIQPFASLFDVSGEIEMGTVLLEGLAESTGHETVAFSAVSPYKILLEIL